MKLNENSIIKLGEILKSSREKNNFTLEQVKIRLEYLGIKVNKSDIQRVENAERKVPNAILIKNLCKIYKLDVIELFKEIGYLDDDVLKTTEKSNTQYIPGNAIRIKTTSVPMYGTASAGPGYYNLSIEVEGFLIPEEDYRPGRFAVKVEGESMTGPGKSIPCGSIALVDPNMCTDIEELINKVCVFTYNDETYIKQLIIDKQNLVHLVSFNPEISDIIVLNHKDLKCDGRVVKTFFEQKW